MAIAKSVLAEDIRESLCEAIASWKIKSLAVVFCDATTHADSIAVLSRITHSGLSGDAITAA